MTDERIEVVVIDYVRILEKEDVVARDTTAFASSRLGVVIGLEAIPMVEEGVANPADIDESMQIGDGYPMGSLELTDYVRLDVRLHIAKYLRSELGERFRPLQTRRRKVTAGDLGKTSARDFISGRTANDSA